jgi:hypothetical protein
MEWGKQVRVVPVPPPWRFPAPSVQLGESMLSEGKSKERLFALQFKKTIESNPEQDIHEHWDIAIKCDIKGIKRVFRLDDKPDENFHYVETQNVNGAPGWLWGQADLFVFETFFYWILVGKSRLQSFIRSIDSDIEVYDEPLLYKKYQRKGRNDILILIKTLDLCYLAEEILKKKEIM